MNTETTDKKIKPNNEKSDNKSVKIISIITRSVTAVMFIIGISLATKLFSMHLLPSKYVIALCAVVVILAIIGWLVSSKSIPAFFVSFVCVLLTGVMMYGLLAVIRLDRTLNKISTDSRLEVVQMSVIVLDEDEAQNIGDISGYSVGFNASDNASDDMKVELTNKLVDRPDYKEYANVMFLADALLDKKVQAVILNSSYIEIISELEGYEDFKDKVRILDTIPVETEATYDVDEKNGEKKEEYKLSSDEDTFVVYISGIDTYGDVNTRSRSDVNILAVVNTKTGNIQLINTPRDYYVPLSISGGVRDKLTHAGIYGIEVSEDTLGMLYDIKVDYYLRMNFSSFEKIIDRLGGIDVYSEYDFSVGSYNYKAGTNHLNGKEALAFARERHAFLTGDVQRGKNQMEVIKAVIAKLTSKDILKNYDAVLNDLEDCFQTDMEPETIYSLVQYQLSSGKSWTVNSYTVTGFDSHDTTYSMPGFTAYVMVPDETKVDEAKRLIEETLNGK